MSIRLGVVMDPIASIHPKKDSTLAMLLAAQSRGWELHYMERQDLALTNNRPEVYTRQLQVFDDDAKWFTLEDRRQRRPAAELDAVLMRLDPPVERSYLYTTYLLEAMQQVGVLVVNQPRSLRDCNEKLYITSFPEHCPPFLVSSETGAIRSFHAEYRDIVLKPLHGMGGHGVFRVREGDANLNVIIQTLSEKGRYPIMAQRYLPEIRDGDKRILLINGEPVPRLLARIPSEDDFRGNLAAGGSGEARPLSAKDREIAARVGPELQKRGLLFVGLDVIGDYLSEINITSPTCIRELDAACNLDIGGQLLDCMAQKIASP